MPGGAGLARRASGASVFVPRTAKGDLVEAEVSSSAKVVKANLLRVVEPSPDRVTPPCSHIGTCGGCDWMHLSAAAQREGHASIVRSTIEHAVGSAEVPAIRIHPAAAELAYRTRARLFMEAHRGLLRVGYRAPGSHAISPADGCHVLDPAIAPLVGDLAMVFAGSKGRGDAQIARGRGGKPVVSLEWTGDLPPSVWAAIDARIADGRWAGARVTLEGATCAATFGDPQPVILGADGAPLTMAAGGFAQASDTGAALLSNRAAELAALGFKTEGPSPRGVVELFAGSGTLSVLLARIASGFTAVELDPAACAAARANLRDRGLPGRVVTADADAFAIPDGTAVVVLDPPRSGAPGAVRSIAASGARSVVYVACDPATLSRDLSVLTSSSRLAVSHIETFELFPQTSHVETIVRLERVR